MRDGFKLFVEHSNRCYLQKQGREEFIVPGGTRWLARDGTHRGTSCMWHTFRCNCTDCGAIVGVRYDVLMLLVSDALGARTTKVGRRTTRRRTVRRGI